MTRRKRTLLAVGLLAVVAIAGAIGVAQLRGDREPPELARIEIGMTQAAVAQVFGRAPDFNETIGYVGWQEELGKVWWTDNSGGSIRVRFDEEGKASSKSYRPPEPLPVRLRRWLGR